MQSSYIEIIGNLEKDIETRETKKGIKYGVIWVGEKRSFNSPFEENKIIHKTYLFKVYIWSQELLNNSPYASTSKLLNFCNSLSAA